MGLPLYLALTASEFTSCSPIPEFPAWMACHFSPYGTGLCNLPPELPANAMVILNDRISPLGHDPEYILAQLAQLSCDCILLDFQQADNAETAELARVIAAAESRPVGVTPQYGHELNCPIFLPPVPIDIPIQEHLAPWNGREIWLEAAADSLLYMVTGQGSAPAPLSRIPERGLTDPELFCHYRIETFADRAAFALWRTREDVDALLEAAAALGVTKAVGLWQELGRQIGV